jgi:hypothetical protein
MIGILFSLFLVSIIFGVGIGGTVLWIWMLIDCAVNEPSEGSDKIVWILVILFTHLLGALIYLLARRPERKRLYGK